MQRTCNLRASPSSSSFETAPRSNSSRSAALSLSVLVCRSRKDPADVLATPSTFAATVPPATTTVSKCVCVAGSGANRIAAAAATVPSLSSLLSKMARTSAGLFRSQPRHGWGYKCWWSGTKTPKQVIGIVCRRHESAHRDTVRLRAAAASSSRARVCEQTDAYICVCMYCLCVCMRVRPTLGLPEGHLAAFSDPPVPAHHTHTHTGHLGCNKELTTVSLQCSS